MKSKGLTVTLLVLILMAVLWSKGRLQAALSAAFGNSQQTK